MGREMAEAFPECRRRFEALDEETRRVIREGPEEDLQKTIHTQPALYACGCAVWDALKSRNSGIASRLRGVAGHSLGEYCALYAAGVCTFEEGLRLVKFRSRVMQEAAEARPGAMAALLGCDQEQVEQILRDAAKRGVCEAANYNAAGQVVISGEPEAVEEALRLARALPGCRAIKLKVSGAFHSSLVAGAAQKMREFLKSADLRDASIPVLTNVDAKPTTSAEEFRDKLADQIDHPVYWDSTVRRFLADSCDTFLELGCGEVLTRLVKRLDPGVKAFAISDPSSLDRALSAISES